MTETRHKRVSLHLLREFNRRWQRTMRLISVQVGTDIREAINLMQVYSISQLPVLDGGRIVGSLDERALLAQLMAAEVCLWGPVESFMLSPLPVLDESARLEEALALLHGGASGVVVTQDGTPVGMVTAADLIAFKVYGGQIEYEI